MSLVNNTSFQSLKSRLAKLDNFQPMMLILSHITKVLYHLKLIFLIEIWRQKLLLESFQNSHLFKITIKIAVWVSFCLLVQSAKKQKRHTWWKWWVKTSKWSIWSSKVIKLNFLFGSNRFSKLSVLRWDGHCCLAKSFKFQNFLLTPKVHWLQHLANIL